MLLFVEHAAAGKGVVVKAFATKDSVLLRWAPTSYDVWVLANRYGYRVDRILISRDGQVLSGNRIQILNEGVILPLKEEAWRTVVQRDSVYAPIALQALWGETFELSTTFRSNLTEVYNKVKENESRYGFAMYCADRSLPVARSLGLLWIDKTVKRNEKYIYRVYINAPAGQAADTGYVVVDPLQPQPLYKPAKPVISLMENKILLAWESVGTDYVGYEVEHSSDGRSFRRVSGDLVIPFQSKGKMVAFHADSLVKGEYRYYYRIRGITPFATAGPYSDTLYLHAAKKIPSPGRVEGKVAGDNQVSISWEYPNRIAELEKFEIHRTDNPTGNYLSVASVDGTKRVWKDVKPLPFGYYRVVAVSKSGEQFGSLEAFVALPDNTPPAPPVGLSSKADTTGVVVVKWNANTEIDLLGYKVYRANSRNGIYAEVTKSVLAKPTFTDSVTLKTITKSVFYKVVSVDKRYNTSAFSLVLEQRRPDIIPPAPPVVRSVAGTGEGVMLRWDPSPSNDATATVIYRKVTEADGYTTVQTVRLPITEFVDTARFSGGQKLYYQLCAVDSTGNRSAYSNELAVVYRAASKVPKGSVVLRGEVATDNRLPFIRLVWEVPPSAKVQLYRSTDKGAFILYKVLENSISFDDTDVRQGHLYRYFIICNRVSSSKLNIQL